MDTTPEEAAQVVALLQQGLSQRAVAAQLHLSQSAVSRVYRRFQETGAFNRRPRTGRHRCTSERDDRFIVSTSLRNRHLTGVDVQQELRRVRQVAVSEWTVRRRLKEANLTPKRPASGPKLTAGHRQARLQFAREHLDWSIAQWRSVLFTDECRVCLHGSDRRGRVYRRPGERFAQCCFAETVAYGGGSCMMWAGISLEGKTALVFVPGGGRGGGLTADRYITDILLGHVVPYAEFVGEDFVLMHDNARCHTARVSRQFLREKELRTMDWPALSPDLNPIEHLWDELKRRVRARNPVPASVDELKTALLEEWDGIPQETVKKLISTGDPHETEIDTVLLLTSSCYLCGSYDEPRDRWGAARVPLAAVASLELGAPATNTTLFNVGRKSTPDAPPCIRINYTVNGEPGYFHMFRSTTLRFFNNMAVRIHTREEMIECLHSICESILVARDVAKLPPIPFMQGVAMEKKKSKVHPTGGHSVGGRASLYLGLSRLPAITRHVSEAQLVADIRNVGSKALTNMSEQFSKLNRLGARAKPSLQLKFDQGTSRTKKIFTLGSNRHPQPQQKKKGSLSDGLSSDYSSDDENRTNIFEPTLDNFENNQVYIGKAQKTEPDNDCDLIENPLYSSKIEPSEPAQDYDTGLVMKFDSTSSKTPMTSVKRNPFDESTSPRPEITIDSVSSKPAPPSSLVLSQKLSHSSSDLDNQGMSTDGAGYHMRSNSQHEITLNIATSHSESALKQLKTMTSPMSSATRDMVLSPLSKIAKGVQNLGANLDPRKIKTSPTVKYISEQQYEEHRKLQEKWRDCKTRLVAL
ncbi:unnamed protein product [Plutella xylostella]|uniref:(diamondback moth) hypothetical protein n=1 Tax=Plutella xylostella TaxID=51655 RepID=A0A8S4ET17_PLUXY|nr:unnamed protein product [Plutella xylostella]